MKAGKGFTLIEMIVVLVIVAIVAAFVIPNLIASSERTKAQMAQNNLLAIAAAEQKYSEDHPGAYCLVGCGDTTAHINSNFYLSISDSFSYSCSAVGETIPYNCQATDNTDKLTLDPNAVSPAPIVTCVNLAGNSGYCSSL